MTTPTKNEIIERAFAIHHSRNHSISSINPEVSELKESGTYEEAKRELMRSEDSEYQTYIEKEAARLGLISDKVEGEVCGFEIDIEELVRSGLSIAGGKGTAKSNLAMIIADKLLRKGFVVKVFDISRVWEKKSSVPNLIQVKNDSSLRIDLYQSTIFDLSRLTPKACKDFISKVLQLEWNYQLDVAEEERKTIIYVFEEVQFLVPQGSLRSNEAQYVLRLMTTGRNFQLGYIGITQRPALSDTSVFELSFQRYFSRMDGQNDIKKVSNYVGAEKAGQLQNLRLGQFYYDRGAETKLIETEEFKSRVKPSKVWQTEPEVKTELQEQAEPQKTDLLQLAQWGLQIGSLLIFLIVVAIAFSSW